MSSDTDVVLADKRLRAVACDEVGHCRDCGCDWPHHFPSCILPLVIAAARASAEAERDAALALALRLARAVDDVTARLGGWREVIGEIEDLGPHEALAKAMLASLDQLDATFPVSPTVRLLGTFMLRYMNHLWTSHSP